MTALLTAGAVELHEFATKLVPTVPDLEDHLDKPSRILIAVERHDKNSERWARGHPKDRFLWVKCRINHRIQKIRETYRDNVEQPNISVKLKMNGATVADDLKVGDMDWFKDRLVVLTAEEDLDATGQSLNLPASGYLPITNNSEPNQNHSTPTGPSTLTPLRLPLQPVSRQLSVPLKQSPDESNPIKLESPSVQPPHLNWDTRWSNVGLTDFARSFPTPPPAAAPIPKLEFGVPDASAEQVNEPDQAAESQEYQPREYNNLFADEEDGPEPSMRGRPLRELAEDATPERLEAGVKAGVNVLDALLAPLERFQDSADVQNWIEQIETVRKGAVKSRTVVGVVGNTGSGKSSVINAMLDEERLVPTNCMRACTAVVTELSYNEKSEGYRAEVEFIKHEDWLKELKVLFEEVFDDNGHIVHDARNPDSEAGIAYAKIRAVYHKHTKEMLSSSTVHDLMKVKHVSSILGTTRTIKETRPEVFYKRLQHYVDSKEKGTEKLDKNGKKITNPKRELEYWPLIKVVKIYTKSEALSTGAVIVDLPGVHDSNAARAAVAEGYMKQCTGLWIVAPINRAVDDKAAKSLLGNTFRRQLKYDGTYSAVTFICSKTDDISRMEAADSLQLGQEMDEIEHKLAQLEQQRRLLTKQLKEAREHKQDQTDTIESIDDQLELWEDLQARLDEGKTVYAPSATNTRKRKRGPKSPVGAKKKRRTADLDDESDVELIEFEEEELDHETDDNANQSRTPLTQQQIEDRVEELKRLKREARTERAKIDDKFRELRKEIAGVEDQQVELDDRQSELCIAGRNEYSRSAIRQDFAAGIKELDQENAEEEDPDNFDPNQDIRDYEEVARSLPVFCVSSRAYQKLSGRMQKDAEVSGFATEDQTEIPQLQAHCKKLTERGRQANCRRFLNSMIQLLNSLGLWASDDGTGAKLTDQQRNAEHTFLDRRLKELEKALDKAVDENLEDVMANLSEQIFEKFGAAVAAATHDALPTANKWGGPRDLGGLHFMTYRATVRRQGVYHGASGFQDFNAQLTEPIYKHLATAWEKSFQRRLPHLLQSFTKTGADILKKFHSAIESRFREKGLGIARIGMLANQLTAYQAIFNDLASLMITQINDAQREINREFTPVITEAMDPAYDRCAGESGIGSYKRMKGHMAGHIDTRKLPMFTAACEKVRDSLDELIKNVRKQMLERVDGIFINMRRDYNSIFGRVNIDRVSMSKEERVVRRELDEVITAADENFQKVLESDLEDLKEADTAVAEGTDIDDDDFISAQGSEQESSEDDDEQHEEDEADEDGYGEDEDGMEVEVKDDTADVAHEEL